MECFYQLSTLGFTQQVTSDVYHENFFTSHITTPHIHNINIYHNIAETIQVVHRMFVAL